MEMIKGIHQTHMVSITVIGHHIAQSVDENGIQKNGRCDDDDDDDDDGDDDNPNDYRRRIGSVDQNRHQKKRKMKSLLSSYEFAPRVAAPSAAATSTPKPLYGWWGSLSDWTEHEMLILLDAWGTGFFSVGGKAFDLMNGKKLQ